MSYTQLGLESMFTKFTLIVSGHVVWNIQKIPWNWYLYQEKQLGFMVNLLDYWLCTFWVLCSRINNRWLIRDKRIAMMLNTTRFKYLFKRLVQGPTRLSDCASKSWTINPSEEACSRPAIYLEGELNNIIEVEEHTNFEAEHTRVKGGVTTHAATRAFEFRNIMLNDGYLYKNNLKTPLITKNEKLFDFSHSATINKASLACSWCGNKYFGHWLTDDLPLAIAVGVFAEPVRTEQTFTEHQKEYANIFDIHPLHLNKAYFNSLYILEDFSQNSYKRERYEQLRSKLAKAIVTPTENKHVMVLRGKSGISRILENELKVADILKTLGFTIVEPEKLSAIDLSKSLFEAEIVVGVEGSHLVHSIFSMKTGGTILAIQPPFRFSAVIKDYTDCLDLNYSFIVGEETTTGFSVNLDRLKKLLDKIIVKHDPVF